MDMDWPEIGSLEAAQDFDAGPIREWLNLCTDVKHIWLLADFFARRPQARSILLETDYEGGYMKSCFLDEARSVELGSVCVFLGEFASGFAGGLKELSPFAFGSKRAGYGMEFLMPRLPDSKKAAMEAALEDALAQSEKIGEAGDYGRSVDLSAHCAALADLEGLVGELSELACAMDSELDDILRPFHADGTLWRAFGEPILNCAEPVLLAKSMKMDKAAGAIERAQLKSLAGSAQAKGGKHKAI